MRQYNNNYNNWDKLKIGANAIGLIIIPIVIAMTGNFFSNSIKEKEIQGKFVELALQVLKEPPLEENKNLRKWAISALSKYSGVTMDANTTNDLVKNVSLPKNEIPKNLLNVTMLKNNGPFEIRVQSMSMTAINGVINVYDINGTSPLTEGITFSTVISNPSKLIIPKFDWSKNDYVFLSITASAISLDGTDANYTVQIDFFQDNHFIKRKIIQGICKGGQDLFIQNTALSPK